MAKKGIMSNLGMLVLAVWLILTGLLQFVDIGIPEIANFLLPLLAIAAGVLLLLNK